MNFELESYLQQRDREYFTVVEIGHRATPIAPYQAPFVGDRRYIGVEANLRDAWGNCKNAIEELKEQLAEQNVEFIDHDPGGEPIRDPFYETSSRAYSGEYNARTCLPDDIADEVVLSNVFGDYHLSDSVRTQSLLDETARLVRNDGLVVIRETITPANVLINDGMLAISGLRHVARYPRESSEWDGLEEVFDGEKSSIEGWGSPNSFYWLFAPESTN